MPEYGRRRSDNWIIRRNDGRFVEAVDKVNDICFEGTIEDFNRIVKVESVSNSVTENLRKRNIMIVTREDLPEDYQIRVYEEREELSQRLVKLKSFIARDSISEKTEKELLQEQHDYMLAYLDTLDARLKIFARKARDSGIRK